MNRHPHMLTRTLIAHGALFACAVLAGCDQTAAHQSSADGARPSPPAHPPVVEIPPEVQALRSVPYIGETDDDADEPETGVTLHDRNRAQPGYNLYSVHQRCNAVLMDMDGRVVREWHAPGHRWSNVELLPDGDLLAIGDLGPKGADGGESRYLIRFDFNGAIRWQRTLPIHHDVELQDDGSLLALQFQLRDEPEIHPTISTRDDELVRLSADGGVVERMSLLDAVRRADDLFPLQRNEPSTMRGQTWIDLFHANAVERQPFAALAEREPLYSRDHVLVCFRHQDRVCIVDWPERRIVWAWGLGELAGPHDAHWLANGNLLIFDNGLGRGWSRVIELNPLTREIVWEFRTDPPESFYTASKGSNQRLANGNTLIASSDDGIAFEITPAGEQVWRFVCPDKGVRGKRASIVRMQRYPVEMIERLLKKHDR